MDHSTVAIPGAGALEQFEKSAETTLEDADRIHQILTTVKLFGRDSDKSMAKNQDARAQMLLKLSEIARTANRLFVRLQKGKGAYRRQCDAESAGLETKEPSDHKTLKALETSMRAHRNLEGYVRFLTETEISLRAEARHIVTAGAAVALKTKELEAKQDKLSRVNGDAKDNSIQALMQQLGVDR